MAGLDENDVVGVGAVGDDAGPTDVAGLAACSAVYRARLLLGQNTVAVPIEASACVGHLEEIGGVETRVSAAVEVAAVAGIGGIARRRGRLELLAEVGLLGTTVSVSV